MINVDEIKGNNFHLVGCGGIGMLGLALMLKEKGAVVSGSDIASGKNTLLLEKKGIKVFIGEHCSHNLPECRNFTLIFSSAVKQDNPELIEAAHRNARLYRRGEFLGLLAENFEKVITVSGSHGKTTVTAMIAFILKILGFNPGFYIGGFIKGLNENASFGAERIFIAEVDESDLSIDSIKSDLAITLNLDNDHSWNVGGEEALFEGFTKYASAAQYFLNGSNKFPEGFLERLQTQGVNFLKNAERDYKDNPDCAESEIENINAAVTAAEFCGANRDDARRVIKEFPGVERRMSIRFSSDKLDVIEDYAHHPEEIKTFFSIIDKRYQDVSKILIFQPHREKRLRYCFDGFCAELAKADYLFILPLFSAWEERSFSLEEKLSNCVGSGKSEFIVCDRETFFEKVTGKIKRTGDRKTTVIFMGAGDIDKLIKPFIEYISSRI